jgi:type IX secretion system PorP/SprF family membrane protein
MMDAVRIKITEMKRIIIIFSLLMPLVCFGQQFPFMENYNLNPFSLSPAYAGIYNSKTLFMDYRSDWSGIEGGPKTYQLSYNDKFKNRVGLGGKFIYDKTDIFKQTLILGTYTYEVRFHENHTLNFGLSMGLYRNSIDLTKYYNDPNYIDDMVLLYGQQKSKVKFATDISALYRYGQGEAGILFSNLMLGNVKYSGSDMTYKPFKNYLLHAAYLFKLDDRWSVKPGMVFRGGQNVPVQFDVSATVTWSEKIWATTLIRTSGILGLGLGGEVYQGVLLNYSYNLSNSINSNVPMNTFGSHQLTLGIRIFRPAKEKSPKDS